MTTALQAPPAAPAAGGARRRRPLHRYRVAPLTLIAANVVLFALFFVWPGAIGLAYSFTDYTGIGTPDFIGFDNYAELFADSGFYQALARTFQYAILQVPLSYALALGIASLLVSKFARGRAVARIVFFIPWLISPIVTGVVWRWMFGENFGFVNFVIGMLGGAPVPWQSNADISLLVVVFAGAWAGTAFNMLLFIAAIRNVPQAYYEAAELDGAGSWQRFRHITLPSIAPTSFIVILLSTIGSIKEFAMIQALNNGGPGTENNLLVQYIYRTGFQNGQIGYASAASMILMVILMVIALVQLWFNKRRGAA
ncbi:sugar ABC transporter permease [Microbacterium sp. JZ37]|uniref:carbohydrate ABC transporter permease n=1 Tax=Microbacterium sp. JZ37 TaxID=2654193 RepID=UPI002B497819|nr:sugar ABC transporter permease [Microbacterium sp. JZ37]WRH16474.1 ABC transporter permease subunit [Microbacterium sp. JZ37]